MKVIVVKNYEEMSREAAKIIIEQIKTKPNSVLGLATGGTPIGMYNVLKDAYQNNEVSFKQATSFNLDEYCGISQDHPQSYYRYMHEQLFDHVDILSENIHLPVASGTDNEVQAMRYNELLKQNTIDLQVLGIGTNGHIGFNEPGTPFDQETFVVELAEKTRLDNQRFFSSLDEVPKYALTMGIKNIMDAKSILMLISGKGKADTVVKLLKGGVTTDFPASILHNHSRVTIIIDEDAYSKMI